MHKFLILLTFFLNYSVFSQDANLGIKHFQQQNYMKAAKHFKRSLKKDPRNALVWFNLGNAQYQLNRHRSAIKSYQRTIKLKSPLAPVARLYQAKSFRKLNNLNMAKRLFDPLSKYKLPKNVRNMVQKERKILAGNFLISARGFYEKKSYDQALKLVQKSLALEATPEAFMLEGFIYTKKGFSQKAADSFLRAKRFGKYEKEARTFLNLLEVKKKAFASAWVSSGYNSNLYAKTKNETSSMVTEYGLTLGTEAFQKESLSMDVFYNFFGLSASQSSNYSITGHKIGGVIVNNLGGSYWSLAPFYQFENLNGEPYRSVLGSNARYFKSFNKIGWESSLDLSFNQGKDPYEYLNGHFHKIETGLAYEFPSSILKMSVGAQDNESENLEVEEGSLPLAYTSFFTQASFTVFKNSWTSSFGARVEQRNYKEVSTPGSEEREDNLNVFFFKIQRATFNNANLFLQSQHIQNSSTLANDTFNKNYNQTVIKAGVSAGF